MEALATALMPLVLLMVGMWMVTRWIIPPRVLETAAGHLLRDFFWVGLRVAAAIVALPFLIMVLVGRQLTAGSPPRRPRGGGRRRRRYR